MSDCKMKFAPCKCCGTSNAVEFLKYAGKCIDYDTWAVICTQCKSESVAVYSRDSAVRVWNEYHALQEKDE